MKTIAEESKKVLQNNINPNIQETLDMLRDMKHKGLIKEPSHGISHNYIPDKKQAKIGE